MDPLLVYPIRLHRVRPRALDLAGTSWKAVDDESGQHAASSPDTGWGGGSWWSTSIPSRRSPSAAGSASSTRGAARCCCWSAAAGSPTSSTVTTCSRTLPVAVPATRVRGAAAPPARTTAGQSRPDLVEYGPLVLDLENYQAVLDGSALDLTYMEYELLKLLAQAPGRVFTRETLLSRVWGYEYYGGARTVDVHIRHLRAKLGEEHAALHLHGPFGGLPLRAVSLGPLTAHVRSARRLPASTLAPIHERCRPQPDSANGRHTVSTQEEHGCVRRSHDVVHRRLQQERQQHEDVERHRIGLRDRGRHRHRHHRRHQRITDDATRLTDDTMHRRHRGTDDTAAATARSDEVDAIEQITADVQAASSSGDVDQDQGCGGVRRRGVQAPGRGRSRPSWSPTPSSSPRRGTSTPPAVSAVDVDDPNSKATLQAAITKFQTANAGRGQEPRCLPPGTAAEPDQTEQHEGRPIGPALVAFGEPRRGRPDTVLQAR